MTVSLAKQVNTQMPLLHVLSPSAAENVTVKLPKPAFPLFLPASF